MRLVLFFFLFGFFCKSQKIEVFVTNKDGLLLENINVQIQKENRTLDFKRTDNTGKATFERPEKGVFLLKLTSVFYKTEVIEIDTNEKSKFEIALVSQITEIEKVEIKSRPKTARLKKDTIFFNINAVKDGTERTTEDVIRKIPGLDINDNGKVTYKGNAIGQVLVEGNEFFGKNHKISTQNISANMLEGIDLWQNYTTISGNTSTAINLKLKEEYKEKITGNVELNYGTKNSYLAHANVFKFGKLGNLALIADANSIAKDPINYMDFYEMNSQDNVASDDTVGNIDVPSFLNNDKAVKSKDNQFGALQYSKSKKNFSITLFSVFNTAQLSKYSTTKRIAFEGQSTDFNFFEQKEENNKGFLGTTQLKVKKNLNAKDFLYYNFSYTPTVDNFNQNINRSASQNQFYNIENDVKNSRFSNFISWNKQIRNSKIILAFNQLQESYTEDLGMQSNNSLFLANSNSLFQKNKVVSENYGLDLYFKNKNSWINFNFHSGFSSKAEVSELSEFNSQSFASQNLNTYHYLNDFNIYKQLGRFEISSSLSSHFLNVNDKDKHYFEKNLKIKYVPLTTVHSEFEIEYSSRNRLPTLKILQYNTRYSRGLSFYENRNVENNLVSKTDSYRFTWNRFNLSKGNVFFVILTYDYSNPIFTTDITNYGTFAKVKNVVGSQNDQWSLFVTNEKRISNSLILKSKFNGSIYRNSNFVNKNANLSTIKSFDISQQLSTRFDSFPVQFDLGYSFSNGVFNQSYYNITSSQKSFKPSLGTRINIKNEFTANILGEYLFQKTEQNSIKNFLIGGNVSYRKEKSNFEYNIFFSNILNLNSMNYINNYTSQLGTDEYFKIALHGYITAGLKYSF